MLTLHNATDLIRNSFKWLLILGGVILISIIILRIAINLKEQFFPTPEIAPNVLFDKLPKIIFPASLTTDNLNFSIDTLSGELPVFPDRANVYKIATDNPNLLDTKTLQEKVAKARFNSKGVKISETKYRFNKVDDIVKNLTIDALSSNFNIFSTYFFDKNVILGRNLPSEEKAKEVVQELLINLEIPLADFDQQKTKTVLFSLQNQDLIKATSISETQIIRVDLFQKDINKLPIFYSESSYSNMNFLVSGGLYEPQIVEAHFDFYKISSDSATYPIKTAEEALLELKKNKSYIVSYNNNDKEVFIKDAFLAYYLPKEKPEYLMPIIVFKGKNDFFAYISAVKDEWIENFKD